MKATARKILAGLGIVALSVMMSALFHSVGLLSGVQSKLSTGLYHEREVDEAVVIVAIDDKSISDIEEGGLGNVSSWPRSLFAETMEVIDAEEPAAIMLDIFLSEASRGLSEEDVIRIFESNTQLDEVAMDTLAYLDEIHPNDERTLEIMAGVDAPIYLISTAVGEGQLINNRFHYPATLEPLELFDSVSESGLANLGSNQDSSDLDLIMGIPALQVIDGEAVEHVDVKLAREANPSLDAASIPQEAGHMWINYAKKSYDWTMVSMTDVVNGRVDTSLFEDKIVLIGATTPRLQDVFFTPIDQKSPMPGVEIHANAIQTLVDGQYLQSESLGYFLMVTTAVLALSVAFFLGLPIWVGAGVVLLEVALFPFYAKWQFNNGRIVDLIWPVFALAFAYLLSLMYRYITEFREKRKIQSAFGHYVSKDLVEQISAHPEFLQLGGERRNLTTLFLDMEHFTTLSEGMEPQDVVALVNVTFDALTQVIMGHGGTVDKFEGDAIMALFGAPLPSEDHAVKACLTALDLRKKLAEVNAAHGMELNIRIGIATGEAIVGNMGSKERFDYTAMGDTVNTASRLEGGNKFYGTRILVNQGTMEAAQGQLVFRRVDRVRLKGKAQAVDIYEVIGLPNEVSAEMQSCIQTWHEALEYYRNQDWENAERRLRQVLEQCPNDGPATTYLKRIEILRMNPPQGWDGTWQLDQK